MFESVLKRIINGLFVEVVKVNFLFVATFAENLSPKVRKETRKCR